MARVTGKRRGVFGNNSANKDSRQGGEDLAEEMAEEDPLTGLPLKSAAGERSSRRAVRARRPDNGQYMSQAVAMLWAGPPAETAASVSGSCRLL